MHKEQIVDMVGSWTYWFSCDAERKYDHDRLIKDDIASHLHMKYPEQGRLCMGVTPVLLMDGKEEGWCCAAFDYTGKTNQTICHV